MVFYSQDWLIRIINIMVLEMKIITLQEVSEK